MGNQRRYIGFLKSDLKYEPDNRFRAVIIGGIKGRVVQKIREDPSTPNNLPIYIHSSEVLFRTNNMGVVVQARVYEKGRAIKDFDWDHEHTNRSTGEVFPKGVVHVQTFLSDGHTIHRNSQQARYMTAEEIECYGELIHSFNPDVKFKP